MTCPACRRIADNFPAGSIEIKGQFFPEHRHEVLSLIRNIEKLENGERPLERIISIEDQEHGIVLTTTGIHIARRIGEALSRSYKGHFSFKYLDAQKSIRVQWER
ncbi:NMD protein affecting ribosome stability and mRNA decay (fragment) [Syntrophobacter sp. SbD1]